MKSMLGTQVLAKWPSAPSFGFGTGTRDQREKIFISMAHVKGVHGRNSPGPASYLLPSASGKQFLSTRDSQPRWAFGSAMRFPRSKFEAAPGPGTYTLQPALGRQITSTFKTMPIFGFGTAGQRANWKVFISQQHNLAFYGRESPGPLTYGLGSTMGKQTLSTMSSSPSISFGISDRSGDQADGMSGLNSPGPGAYTLDPAIGRQLLSTMRSAGTMSFGTAKQSFSPKQFINKEINMSFYGRDTPGPCTALQQPGFYRQPLSRNRTSPQFGFGSVRAPRRPAAVRRPSRAFTRRALFRQLTCARSPARSPACSCSPQCPRFRETRLHKSPGPGAYCV
jgi:hypothetical protein